LPDAEPDLAVDVEIATGLALADVGDVEAADVLTAGAVLAQRRARPAEAARCALALADLAERQPHRRGDANAVIDQILRDAAGSIADAVDGSPPRWWARLVARRAMARRGAAFADDAGRATAVLVDALSALKGPDDVDERSTLAQELASVAAVAGDRRAGRLAWHHRAMAQAIAGEDVSVWAARVDRWPTATGPDADQPDEQFDLTRRALVDRAVARAVTEGRFAAARRLAEAHAGGLAGHQLVLAQWFEGTLMDNAGSMDVPVVPLPRPQGVMLEAAEDLLRLVMADDLGPARVAAHQMATEICRPPFDDAWLHSIAVFALATVELRDGRLADELITVLRPFAMMHCGIGYRTFAGPVSFHLGRLSAVVGHWSDAERYLTSALRQLVVRRARPWVAMTQWAMAEVLERRSRRPADFDVVPVMRAEVLAVVAELGLRHPVTIRHQLDQAISSPRAARWAPP
jgi:hypothetical protein